ncbi:hypothetical protein NPIL_626561 [Nephila pilipes]|uniref:Uncharacterized protein n=1 Tax=Nephila pilipes TaxID=299642 RepID=A0A8X6TFT9_NEPPI|nr:hypothetical protein NPIL_626561 [Nephila pilipes]
MHLVSLISKAKKHFDTQQVGLGNGRSLGTKLLYWKIPPEVIINIGRSTGYIYMLGKEILECPFAHLSSAITKASVICPRSSIKSLRNARTKNVDFH